MAMTMMMMFSTSSSSPLVQFNLLHSKFHLCSVPTRALLLSAYIKFINLFPETKATIQEVLRCDSQIRNSDVELQQRAVEYLKLSSIASTDVLVSAHQNHNRSHVQLGCNGPVGSPLLLVEAPPHQQVFSPSSSRKDPHCIPTE